MRKLFPVLLGVILTVTGILWLPAAASAATCNIPVVTGPVANTARLSNLPQSYTHDSTDGDALAVTTWAGLTAVAGNFTHLYVDGVPHAASNLAVFGTVTGSPHYLPSGFNSYIRAVAYSAPYLYVGGDFTAPRNHIAQIDTRTWTLTAWNPGYGGTQVRAIAAGVAAVYYAGSSTVIRAVSISTGATIATTSTVGGPVHALILSAGQSALYVAGQFEQVGTLVRHGLQKLTAATLAVTPTFDAHLTADSGGQTYNGEEGLSLSWLGSALVDGNGGATVNSLYVLNAQTGAHLYAQVREEGDNQAVVTVLGNSAVAGYHRNHDNTAEPGCPTNYYGAQYAPVNGQIALETYWDPGLSGTQSNTDGGNNGITGLSVDPTVRRLVVVGGFTKHWQSCPTWNTCVDTANTTSMQSIAVYAY